MAVVALWLAFLLATSTFLILTEVLSRSGVFWAYGLLGVAALAFVFSFQPETKGKSLEQVAASWR